MDDYTLDGLIRFYQMIKTYPEDQRERIIKSIMDTVTGDMNMVRVDCALLFEDWVAGFGHPAGYGNSVYSTDECVEVSMGLLHSGSTFKAVIDLPIDEIISINRGRELNIYPVFKLVLKP